MRGENARPERIVCRLLVVGRSVIKQQAPTVTKLLETFKLLVIKQLVVIKRLVVITQLVMIKQPVAKQPAIQQLVVKLVVTKQRARAVVNRRL